MENISIFRRLFMKKKFSLWLNIITICLCFCAMAVGVYSLKMATLNIGGTLGFTMHDAMVEVSGTIYDIAQINNGTTERTNKTIEKIVMGGDSATTTTLDVGELNFFKGYDMVFNLTFKNLNDYSIYAKITLTKSSNDVTPVSDNDYISLPYPFGLASRDSKTIVFALRLNNQESVLASSDFTINVEIEQLEHNQGELYIENNKLYVEYGFYPSVEVMEYGDARYGNNLGKPIRWLAFSTNLEDALEQISAVPTSGTYYFVSECTLTPNMVFNNYTSTEDGPLAVDGKNPNDYEVSEVRKYINGDFIRDYQLSALVSKVTARKLPRTHNYDGWAVGVDEVYSTNGYLINNCTDNLWLLSPSENVLVCSVTGLSSAGKPSSPLVRLDSFWLREAAQGPLDVWIWGNDGDGHMDGCASFASIRPAFQIAI